MRSGWQPFVYHPVTPTIPENPPGTFVFHETTESIGAYRLNTRTGEIDFEAIADGNIGWIVVMEPETKTRKLPEAIGLDLSHEPRNQPTP